MLKTDLGPARSPYKPSVCFQAGARITRRGCPGFRDASRRTRGVCAGDQRAVLNERVKTRDARAAASQKRAADPRR